MPTRQSSGRDASKRADFQIIRDAVSANPEALEGAVNEEEDADYEAEKNSRNVNTIDNYFF